MDEIPLPWQSKCLVARTTKKNSHVVGQVAKRPSAIRDHNGFAKAPDRQDNSRATIANQERSHDNKDDKR
jgi:hypothetical protein